MNEFLEQAGRNGFLASDIDPVFAAEFLMAQIKQGTNGSKAKKELFFDSRRLRKEIVSFGFSGRSGCFLAGS